MGVSLSIYTHTHSYTNTLTHIHSVDEDLMAARVMMAKYTHGYGIDDAVSELKTVKAHLRREKERSEKLTNDLNNRVRQLQKWVAENRTLRDQLNVADEWHLDENELELHYSIESQKSQVRACVRVCGAVKCFLFSLCKLYHSLTRTHSTHTHYTHTHTHTLRP
jgi:hypothetical protein